MKKARFWTGIVILMSPITGIVIARTVDLLLPAVSVEGRVTYQGRPLRGGMICLVSQDRERSGDMMGRIGPDGSFSCRPRWWKSRASRTSFLIRLYPDPRRKAHHDEAPRGPENPPMSEITAAEPRRASGRGITSKVVLATMPSMAPAPSPLAGSSEQESRPDVHAGPLEVSLGSERVHIDIDLGG